MSKPSPNRPQTRIRFTVLGAKPRWGSTKGAAIRPMTVSVSIRKGRCLSITRPRSLASLHAEKAVRPHHEHERHRRKQHHIGIAGVEHRGDADDFAGDQAAEDCAWERADATDHHHDESLDQD